MVYKVFHKDLLVQVGGIFEATEAMAASIGFSSQRRAKSHAT